jgi:glycosyltransferase involved in cell wall biosynthesis
MTRLSFIEFDGVVNREFDVAIATTWTTVFNLPYVPARRWAYLVQSIESRFFDQPIHQSLASLAEATYALRLPTVTVSTWLSTYLLHTHGSPSTTILPGVDREVFNEAGTMLEPKPAAATRVLVEGSLTSTFKRVPESIEAAVALAGIELWHVGSTLPEPLTGVSKSFGNVSQLRLAEIYRSCDILVRLSRVEGLGMTPLEMFHCGGTAVTSDVTGHEEYMIDGHNCLVVDTNQPANAREAVTRLIDNRELLARLKINARRTADQWPDWGTASTRFAAFLDTLIRTGPTPSSETVEMTRRLGAQLDNTTEFINA